MAKILGEKHLHLHHCHEKIKSIEPTWLTHSLLVLVWVWLHSLAVTCIICDSDACCSSRSQDPALISGYSHLKPQHTKSKINKALNTDTQLFFSLQFSYFHFCTSVSIVQCFTLARSIALILLTGCCRLGSALYWRRRSTISMLPSSHASIRGVSPS